MTLHPTYEYTAVRADGATERGVVEARTREQAAEYLTQRRLFPTSLEPVSPLPTANVRANELGLMLRMLSDLLDAGHPLDRALTLLQGLVSQRMVGLVSLLKEDVSRGLRLGDALDNAGVPTVVATIVSTGEGQGGLVQSLGRAATLLEDRAARIDAIRASLLYPMVLLFGSGVAVGLLAAVVIPRFATIVIESGVPVPTATRIVLSVTHIARVAFVPALAVLAVIALVILRFTGSGWARERRDALLLNLPVVGPLRWAAASTRVAESAAFLLEGHAPAAAALAAAAETADDAEIRRRVWQARERIIAGESISQAFHAENVFTDSVIRLLVASEQTGKVAAGFRQGARVEAARVDRDTRRLIAFIEPAIIIVLGMVVALVAAGLLQAVYAIRPVSV